MIKKITLEDPNYFVQIVKLMVYQVGIKINMSWPCRVDPQHEHWGNVVATHPESMSVSVWVQD